MSDDLIKRITSIDYEEFGSLCVNALEASDLNLILSLEVTADEEPDIPKDIRITCGSVKESNLAPGYYQDLVVSKDHVLLWHYTQPYALTSFYGTVEDPLAVIGALFQSHVALVEDWIPFQKYLNCYNRLPELIGGSFGMLAQGPEPLILAYEEVMQRYGISTSHHSNKPLDSSLSIMLFNDSYVIAESFEANAINGTRKHNKSRAGRPVRGLLGRLLGRDG